MKVAGAAPLVFVLLLIFISPALFPQAGPESAASGEVGPENPEAVPAESAASGEAVPAENPQAAQSEAAGPETAKGLDPASVLERDIATSTTEELADWCRSLGLDGGGGREALTARLWEYHKLTPPPVPPAPAPAADGGAGGASVPGPEGPGTEGEEPLLITIESARSTEYVTVKSVNEEYVRLRGGVSVTLKDGEILHRVQAGEILYNRTRKLLTASGGVVYIKEEGDRVETFRGEGITVNLDNWSTAFMRGVSDHEMTEGETRYRFSGEVISRSGENSTVLRRAEITNAAEPEAFWSINASKLWLLPGSDWAALSAVIKVGEIPVLWFPAFYYPANEIIFHPVLGFRSREGTFVQTTTYILGRPKTVDSTEMSSITNIMGSGEGMEKTREGVFLRSTGRRVRDMTEPRLSLMADAYTNLGYFAASELVLPPRGAFGEILFSAGTGFSRDIALDPGSGIFTPFFPGYDGTSNWHRSRFFDYELPFRYRFVGSGSVSASGTVVSQAGLSWSIPLYSDPYVDNDFMRRSEDSSLFSLIKKATTPDMTVSDTSLNSYTWQLNGSLGIAASGLNPYINELAVTSAAAAVTFETRTTSPVPASSLSYPPNLKFYYPDKFTLFSVAAVIGGVPLTLGERPADTGGPPPEASPGPWGSPLSPWGDGAESGTGSSRHSGDSPELTPPALNRAVNAPVLGGHRFTLDYRLTPSAASELRFNSDRTSGKWERPEDIDWSDVAYQLYTIRADGTVGLTLSEKRDIYTHSLRFYGVSSWQDYAFLNETAAAYNTSAQRQTAMRQVHNMTYFTGSAEYAFTLRPFYRNEVWQTSNFRYSVRGLLARTIYDPVSDSWDFTGGKWNRDDLEFHRLQANLNANVMDKTQNLSLTADIPPEESAIAGDATARVWISETNARARIRRPLEDPYYEPVYFTETLRFTDRFSLRYYMVYDPELSDLTIVTSSLVLGNLTASFTATRSKSYYLDTTPTSSGWYVSGSDEKLNPQELSVAYQRTQPLIEGGRFTFQGSVNTGVGFDLQRYTYSKFFFTLGLTAGINRFLDVTLSSHSENAEIFRYYQSLPFFDQTVQLPGEENVLVDLVNSFRFDDIEKRKASGFKLKSFNLDLVHHLGDWDATLGIRLAPEFVPSAREYRFYSQISFLVQWKPVKEFKTDMKYTTKDGFSYE
ncbi:MAG: LPS-assembly protein LptD [Treponema sp.]|jgi:hypothetical protein|nr:LPS-assembly protein LptD [Treponema sp.]